MPEMPMGGPAGGKVVAATTTVDIVVPVFNSCGVTRRCIESVFAATARRPFELVVIDDASTDVDLLGLLADWAAVGRLTLIRNDVNRGFVHSANRGLSLHPDRDVVLLNSDTEVAGDWLDRLVACAYRRADVGTVTPFSNNATICSFPLPCRENGLPEGMTVAEVDAAFARANAGKSLPLPTAVGFCMYIRRACMDKVGLFNEARFGRGYGEENDFCRRALAAGWSHLLCADTFVHHAGSASFGGEREHRAREGEDILKGLYPDYLPAVHSFIRTDPAAPLRRAVEIEWARQRRTVEGRQAGEATASAATIACLSPAAKDVLSGLEGRPVQLHVVHDLAGGIERWCRDYCRADQSRANLILKPFCRGHAAGEGLMLFADIDDSEPIGLWIFSSPFEVCATSHAEYARVLGQIIESFGVGAVIVSSLIGHSLDVLDTGLPTAVVAHDYFPACPAINLHYDGVCHRCDDERLLDCMDHNPDFNPFLAFTGPERIEVRQRWLRLVADRRVTVVTPSRVVWEHLRQLFPTLSAASAVTIPHGTDTVQVPVRLDDSAPGKKLRVVVLGMLSVNKGVGLLRDALERLSGAADFYLLGAMEVGELFADHSGVHVIPRYELAELGRLIQDIRPNAGLLLSIWPETFSYTLTELMQLAVPPVATRLGGFAERIIDGDTGFLIEPTADALVACVEALAADREALSRVRRNLLDLPHRSAGEMVADYHRLLPLDERRTIAPGGLRGGDGTAADVLGIRQAVAMTAMWKQIKSLDLQLAMSREAHPRAPGPAQIAEGQRRNAERQREMAEHQRAVAEHQRTIAEHQRAVAEQQRAQADKQLDLERRECQRQVHDANSALRARDNLLGEKNGQLQELKSRLDAQNLVVHQILTSTSWRLSAPIRIVGGIIRRSRFVIRHLLPMLREPRELGRRADFLLTAWRTGGRAQVKQALLDIQAEIDHQGAWPVFHRTFAKTVRPRIAEAVGRVPSPPVISVIVPTYNTPLSMLEQMIDSVKRQLYPCWELCIADDCSQDELVREMLSRHARQDRRIQISLSDVNRGVSHASNRALEMASGLFVILLDHDDILEEQALFRVAEAILADDPDMLYSDEIMVSENQDKVLQYAFRPAFSPEFLRSHPYIVHLVGFRTSLLRAVGGFDENLRISQDYDLILRVAERASKVVHIPEILYRWRIHDTSTGMQRMKEVTETSRSVLERHLSRCGEVGVINDGAGFNLFDARYSLVDGARVAIVIPTKNHGELVRQCVESIRATVRDVDYDIVVVDHDSTDPATLDYLSSISSDVRVLHHVGPFNFSTINNEAVRQLGSDYSHYLFCNNDIEAIRPGWLERMLELGQRPDVGIVGAQLFYPDRETIQHAGVCVGAFGAAEHFGKFIRASDVPRYLGFSEILRSNHEVSAVTAACLLIRSDAYETVKGFDEAFAVGFGDVDLCLRVGKAGYRVIQCAHAELLHHESFTRGKSQGVDPHPEDSNLFRARWAQLLQDGDPYFNPALNQNSTAWLMTYPIPCRLDVKRRVWTRPVRPNESVSASSPGP